MMLDLYASMPFADRAAMLAFWGDHAMAHGTIASRLGTKLSDTVDLSVSFGSGDVIAEGIFDIADQVALAQWAQSMTDPDNAAAYPEALNTWLQNHQALHVAEIQALGITTPFDLSVLDARSQDQFNDWMDTHARLHKAENYALGI